MLTRCPHCATTFRVTPEQLKVRHGRVRCGHCQDVFNALDTLIEAAPAAEVAAPSETAAEAGPAPPAAAPSASEDAAVETDSAASDAVANEAADEPSEAARFKARQPKAPADPDAHVPELEPLLHEAPRRRVWPWSVGAVLATVALMAQAAIHYRTEIAVLYPAAKPMLNAACAPLGCEVSLPHKTELVGIESSSLAPEADSKLALSATLKNRAPFAQQYPVLELTLSDTADKTLVRRVLAPADYLPPKTDIAAGFPAGSEIAINLAIDAPDLLAAGYQLYLFYP